MPSTAQRMRSSPARSGWSASRAISSAPCSDEPILLVLDNFETNLKPQAEPSARPESRCGPARTRPGTAASPCWRAELAGTPSRVLITCRRPLAALAGTACHRVLLGPLPAGEAALYLREHAGLSRMVFGGDAAERALAMRLLNASRFHPLLMDRLARLATGGPALRPQLLQALDALEKSKDFAQLPALFATSPGDAKELAYLNDALATSLDQLIRDASPDARRLLWMIAVANEPVTLGLLKGVWSGESHEQQQLRQIKQMLEMLPQLPPELQAKLKAMPAELRASSTPCRPRPRPGPIRRRCCATWWPWAWPPRSAPGRTMTIPTSPATSWSASASAPGCTTTRTDRADLTENAIRLAYAERLEAVFEALQHQNMTAALAGRQPRPGLLRPGRGLRPAGWLRQRRRHQHQRSPPAGGPAPAPGGRRRVGPGGPAALVLPLLPRRCAEECWSPRCQPAVLRAGRRPRPAPPPRPGVKTDARPGRISPGSPATGRPLS